MARRKPAGESRLQAIPLLLSVARVGGVGILCSELQLPVYFSQKVSRLLRVLVHIVSVVFLRDLDVVAGLNDMVLRFCQVGVYLPVNVLHRLLSQRHATAEECSAEDRVE
jgi:hypothetical protein